MANAIADQSSAEDAAWSFQVPADAFTDADNDALSYTATLGSGAALPTWLSFNAATRTFSGTPPQDLNGAIDLKVTASDGSLSASDTFALTIDAVNDAPVAAAIAENANEDGPLVTLTASYTDVDAGDSHTFTVDTTGTQGAVTNNGDGTFSYDPNGKFESLALNETATDTFSYTVDDGHGGTSTATATVTINGQNDAAPVFDLTFLSATQGFIIQGDTAGDRAGSSVASAGDVNGDGFADLIVGAYGGDDGGILAGEAYVVFGKTSGFGTPDVNGRQVIDLTSLSHTDGFIIQGDTQNDFAGFSVASAGDVNGDGFADLIVAAHFGDDGGNMAGEAYVVFGKASGFGTPDVNGRQVIDLTGLAAGDGFIIQGDAAFDRAGSSVASAGDVNGDGFADLIVGARFGDDGGTDAGEAYVVFGKAAGFGTSDVNGRQVIDLTSLSAIDGFIIQGDTGGDQAGFSVASAGDVNGDGFADLIVGAPGGDDGGNAAGEAYVVFGKAAGFGTPDVNGRQVIDLTSLSATDGFVIQGDTAGDLAGVSVASAGDVNGDGFTDLIVGAFRGDDGGYDAGEAYVVFGKPAGFGTPDVNGRQVIDLTSLSATDGFIIRGDAGGDLAAWSVASAGDVNGDGFADLIVGAFLGDDGGNAAGEAYVLFGGAFGASDTPVTTAGTAAAEIFIGGVGNDSLAGSGGADVFHAGAGNDVIEVADTSFKLADGGTGTDVLRLMGSGLTLDLTTLANNKISGIEKLDLTGTGNNSLKLNLSDVFDLSDSANQVFVNGDAGDSVTIAGGGWTNAGAETHDGIDYSRYIHGIANVLVEQDITTAFG